MPDEASLSAARFDSDVVTRRVGEHAPRTDGDRGDHNLNPGMTPTLGPRGELTPAAVLVALIERPDGLTTLFTQRTNHLVHHPGQVSFPGGHADPDDASPEDTALREAWEEVGLERELVRIVGRLDQYHTRTGFAVTPVVGLVKPPFETRADPHEVADIFEVPLDFLMDPANHQRHSRDYQGASRHFYAMPYNDHFIWGATAGMLINMFDILSVQ